MSNRRGEKLNLFGGGGDLQDVSDDIYGKSEIPDEARVVARPTAISTIWADVKQPRRAIPLSIRMHWNGKPDDVPDMLGQWYLVAQQAAGVTFNVVDLLNGEGEGIDSDKFPSVAQDYLDLVRLAQGIKADGLINPITIIESDSKLLIESGERRWLAYHLLNMYLGEQWAKIPAAKGSVNDSVWRQASENTQRRQLNPIGMARQLALLIMAARGGNYQEYEEIVTKGMSDRRYYAQVHDGNLHRVPSGMGERIQAAMGLSMEQLSRYRALLRLTNDELVNDVLWTRADIESWAEGALREMATLPIGKVSEVLQRSNWTLDDLKALKPPAPRPQLAPEQHPVTNEWMNKRVVNKAGQFGMVTGVLGDDITVSHDGGQRSSYYFGDLTIVASQRPGPAPVSPAPQPGTFQPGTLMASVFAIGDRVRTRTGTEGDVVSVSGRLIGVKTTNGTTNHDYSLLTKLPPKGVPLNVPKTAFKIGEAVMVIDSEMVGKITRLWDGQWGVLHPDNRVLMYDEDDLTSLGMPWEQYVKEHPIPIQREWREGWTDGEGGNKYENASDKADSPTPAVEPKRIFDQWGDDWDFLDDLETVANDVNDEVTSDMLKALMDMTDLEAIQYQDAQQLQPKLDDAFNLMRSAMEQWLTVHFAQKLQKVLDAAQ